MNVYYHICNNYWIDGKDTSGMSGVYYIRGTLNHCIKTKGNWVTVTLDAIIASLSVSILPVEPTSSSLILCIITLDNIVVLIGFHTPHV